MEVTKWLKPSDNRYQRETARQQESIREIVFSRQPGKYCGGRSKTVHEGERQA